MASRIFSRGDNIPGHGIIHISMLPSGLPAIHELSYQYPLKLIAPSAADFNLDGQDHRVHTVFLLTYGGGLVAGDEVNLNVKIAACTRLILLTQGSTKIFKSDSLKVVSLQSMTLHAGPDSALCYLPDPVQPFQDSVFEQRQTYWLDSRTTNLCICDWVCEGRTARGERWSFRKYASRNEFWTKMEGEDARLLLRDNLILDDAKLNASEDAYVNRMHGLGVFGTLIMVGPMFDKLGISFMEEFRLLPRIGSKQWDIPSPDVVLTPEEVTRNARLELEKREGVLWTVAFTRGFHVVKFGAREVQGGKRWLRAMLQDEGTVDREFGDRALICLR